MTSLDKYSDKGQRQRIKRSRDLILRNAMKGWQGLLYSHKWLDVLTSESSPNRGHKKAAHLKYKRMGRAALPLKPDVAQRTLKFLPMAAVITVAVVYGVSQLRSTPRTDCDKHRESDEELRILDAKSSAASKRPQ